MTKKGKEVFSAEDMIADFRRKLELMQADAEKFDGGTKAAGMRLRKVLKDIKDAASAYRKAIVEKRNEM